MGAEYTNKIKSLLRTNLVAEHAMEFVAAINDVAYINDSISITVEKTWNSLNSIDGNVILIIGGLDSKNDYSSLVELISKKVTMIITVGSDNTKILNSFLKTGKEIIAVDSIQDSVELAKKKGCEGDFVLLSPSCPSFHPFDNYKNRGNDFKRAVNSIMNKNESA